MKRRLVALLIQSPECRCGGKVRSGLLYREAWRSEHCTVRCGGPEQACSCDSLTYFGVYRRKCLKALHRQNTILNLLHLLDTVRKIGERTRAARPCAIHPRLRFTATKDSQE